MSRIDIVRLRKDLGISQRKLAEMIDIRPSFLSAIENGRSRMPEDKLEKLKTLFGQVSLDDYFMEDTNEIHVPPHTHINDSSDSLTQLLNHFHNLAHQKLGGGSSDREEQLKERIDVLSGRNDRLSDRLDDLRDEIDALRKENLLLKELLIKNGIQYQV